MFGSTFFVFLMAIISTVNSECPNGCSGHGTCNAYDICTCDAQHQGNDCSERTCAFGKAHSDISKGDINGDGVVSNSDLIVGQNGIVYRYGTTEGFPSMTDSDQTILQNTAHDYAECSSKGTCDRSTGTCHCFPGYDGVACQRASCPGYPSSCSGHGVCKTIKQLASADFGNIYELWDEDATMGCECDSGYFGADCSLRKCKVGQDPLYEDDVGQRKTAQYFVGIFTTNTSIHDSEMLFHDGTPDKLRGSYRYLFTDEYGKKWETATLYDNADCTSVVNAFQGIPSDVLPPNAIRCTHLNIKNDIASDIGLDSGYTQDRLIDAYNGELIAANMMNFWMQNYGSDDFDIHLDRSHKQRLSGDVYVLRFPTISRLPAIEIERYIDGNSNDPTLVSDGTSFTYEDAKIVIYSDGQLAETNDWFGDYCIGVQVQIKVDTEVGAYIDFVGGEAEGNKLKTCLGDADGYSTNNIGLENWDYGNYLFPHLIKITKLSKNVDDDSDYLAIYYSEDIKKFIIMNPYVPRDMNSTMMSSVSEVPENLRDYTGQSNNWYNLFTTQGTMKLVSRHSQVIASPGFPMIYTVNATNDYSWLNEYNSFENNDGDLSCENYASGKHLTPDMASQDSMTEGATFASCIQKDDWILLLGAVNGTSQPKNTDYLSPQEGYNDVYGNNPAYINIYQVKEIGIRNALHTKAERVGTDRHANLYEGGVGKNQSSAFLRNQITLDQSPNFHSINNITITGPEGRREINVYKFFPSTASTYEVIAECSGRGTCDTTTGLCQCFAGYTGDACSIQAVTSC